MTRKEISPTERLIYLKGQILGYNIALDILNEQIEYFLSERNQEAVLALRATQEGITNQKKLTQESLSNLSRANFNLVI